MAHAAKFSDFTVNAKADAVAVLLDNGYLRIYDGSKPATADTSITTQVLLAELRFDSPAAPAATDGVLTINPLTADASANASGTATWFRAFASDGTTALFDGTVGTAVTDIVLNSVTIVATTPVTIDGSVELIESKG